MRKAVLVCVLASVAASIAIVRTGDAAPKPGLAHALRLTAKSESRHYTLRVRITKDGEPLSLHVRGQSNERTISVHLKVGAVRLPDGTKAPGPNGAVLLLEPFLYERAPSSLAVLGELRWLRQRLADLPPTAPELKAVHAVTPQPLLRLLSEARMKPAKPGGHLYRGRAAYDNPAVRGALTRLTGGIEFRRLRVTAWVGADGLVHRISVTGATADGSTKLLVSMRLFAFDRPIHVTPPKPGTFMDEQLAELTA